MIKNITIEVSSLSKANLSLIQNNIPIIQTIKIINSSNEDLSDLSVEISSDPNQAFKGTHRITLIRKEESFDLETPELHYSWDFFQNCNEKVAGTITIKLYQGETLLIEKQQEIEFSSSAIWLGQAIPIELLCSYITPNNSGVQTIIRSAAKILEEKSGRSALDGYQSNDKTRVYALVQSLYLAIRKTNIVYAEPPASFEKQGQKIRTVNDILTHQLGSCLDLALFFGSCLEQCGLNALVFIIQGHAFTGVWLEEKNLPRAFDEDPQFFRKRIKLQELVVFETTAVTSKNIVPFSEAEKLAEAHFLNEQEFLFGIDVKYCRSSALIYPLNEINTIQINTEQIVEERNERQDLEKKEFDNFTLPSETVSRKSELDLWQDKLLDLTFRNRLLNFRTTQSTVKIECNNPDDIEDLLADGSVFELLPKPENRINNTRNDAAKVFKQTVIDGFSKKKLITNLPQIKFHQILKKLFRDIRTMQEETGANTLYLSLGILEWQEDDVKGKVRHSPLILLPVELKKRAVGLRYSIVMRDNETVLNYTLLQKLTRDFGLKFPGLDPLPMDNSGVDVELIFNTIRTIIKDNRGWELKNEVWLSEFTFQKYLMWKELAEQFPSMLKSPVVARIMGERKETEESAFVNEDQIDDYSLEQIYCPLSADSSQLAAIFSANEGKSFVLQGPPGTGKSQTITNMISHCLAHGKSVLFVSEKRVALDVVYKRLKSVGLESSCLVLHSKKSEKKAVIQSFYEALEAKSIHTSKEWTSIVQNLEQIRGGLNGYFQELHDNSVGGISAYTAFSKANRSQNILRLEFEAAKVYALSSQNVDEISTRIKHWQATVKTMSDEEYQNWKYCRINHWSTSIEDKLKKLLTQTLENHIQRNALIQKCADFLPFDKKWSETEWIQYSELTALFFTSFDMTFKFLTCQDWQKERSSLKSCLERLTAFENQMITFIKVCDPKILKEDISQLEQLNRQTKNGFFLSRWIAGFKLNSILKKYSKQKTPQNEMIRQVIDLSEKQHGYITDISCWEKWFDCEFTIKNLTSYEKQIELADRFFMQFSSLFGKNISLLTEARSTFLALAENRQIILADGSENQKNLTSIHTLFTEQKKIKQELKETYLIDTALFEKDPDKFVLTITGIVKSFSKFRDLCAMNKLREEISRAGFSAIFEAIDTGVLDKNTLISAFDFNFYTHWLSKRLESSKILEQLSGQQLTIKDLEYRETYGKYQDAVKQALVSKVMQNKPVINSDILPTSPLGTILKESKKSRKHLPIRKFLSTIKPVVKNLKPCFLMSPMSVSQYLDVAPEFDIVIFDEASQIQPWDAVGSMARGKQAIVVGDSKQLPPTSFFSANGEESDDEKIDCESVLEMFATLYPEMLLKWHYRSQSESLISFSNYHIYKNRLHTFPSANTKDQAVTLDVVSGVDAYYDRGKTKTNRREAISVVEELFFRLENKSSTNSIGIVTFSTPQATLIEDLIDDEINKKSQFAHFFEPTDEEYVFVKNLESVQGDERDVILFSIGYGKDRNGVINKNFGPLNNSGGERRLNVAVTRARQEVKIFSNFRANEFDVGSSKSEGLALLKEYLAFAESGHTALFMKTNDISSKTQEALFEKGLAEGLEELGWKVQNNIGVGGYRIDLAIVHPENTDIFLAGIECDGSRYFSAKSARDRDILRKSVLEGLKWNMIRVWSTDWWYDQTKVIEKVNHKLQELLSPPSQEKKVVKEQITECKDEADPIETKGKSIKSNEISLCENLYDTSILSISSQGEFFESKSLIKKQINEIISILAPISKEECFTMIRKGWGFTRAGNKIRTFLDDCSSHIHCTDSNNQEFFWKSQDQQSELKNLRIPKSSEKRHPKSISYQELILGIIPILELNKEVEKIELYRIITKKLGFASVSQEVSKIFDDAVELLVEKNRVVVNNTTVSLIE